LCLIRLPPLRQQQTGWERWFRPSEKALAESVAGIVAFARSSKVRRPKGVIHHSDQGSQYTSIEFGHRCRAAGVRPSMGSVGDAYDNAMCESFFATLECELLDRRRFKTQAEARLAVFSFIEGFYNPREHFLLALKEELFRPIKGCMRAASKSRVAERLYRPILYSIVRGPAVGPVSDDTAETYLRPRSVTIVLIPEPLALGDAATVAGHLPKHAGR
jgi:hypothetical protein